MSKQRGIRAGKAFVELTANDTALVRGLRQAQRKLRAFGARITGMGAKLAGAGAIITGPIIAATKSFADYGDAINKASARTGLTAEQFSGLAFAAEQSGADAKILEAGFRGMARTLLNAERGLSTSTDALDLLGLSLGNLQGKSPDEQFKTFAERISQIEDPTQKAAVAMQVFGRSGQMLVPLLDAGAGGIAEMQAEAERLGFTLSDVEALAAAELTDAINRLRRALHGAWIRGGAALAEGMTKLINYLSTAAANTSRYVRENKSAVKAVAAIGAALGVAGTALVAFGSFAILASASLGLLASAISFVLSPIGILVGVFGTIAALVAKNFTSIKNLGDLFGALAKRVQYAFQFISDIIQTGNIEAAVKVMWANLQALWVNGSLQITKVWYSMTDALFDAVDNIQTAISGVFISMVGSVRKTVASAASAVIKLGYLAAAQIAKLSGNDAAANNYRQKADQVDQQANADAKQIDTETQSAIEENKRIGQQQIEERKKQREGRLDNLQKDLDAANKALEDAKKELSDKNAEAKANGRGIGSFASSSMMSGSAMQGTFSAFSARMFAGASGSISPDAKYLGAKLDRLYNATDEGLMLS